MQAILEEQVRSWLDRALTRSTSTNSSIFAVVSTTPNISSILEERKTNLYCADLIDVNHGAKCTHGLRNSRTAS